MAWYCDLVAGTKIYSSATDYLIEVQKLMPAKVSAHLRCDVVRRANQVVEVVARLKEHAQPKVGELELALRLGH